MKKLLALLLACACYTGYSQSYPPVTIPGSEIRKISSSIVTGQEYELHILLPGGYASNTRKFPVIYLMDSQWDFPLVKSIYGQQYYDGFIPEVIVVGVTWGGTKPNPDSLRARDYTPTREQRLQQSGGADQFLRFMKEELFGFMQKNYRVSEERVLMGCSLGGLFTLYTLFTHTDMFTGYVAASPAIGWDREVLYQFENKFYEKKTTEPVHVYMTVGDVENSRSSFEKMANHLNKRQYANMRLHSKILENTGHSGTKSETYTRGLQFVYERKKLALSAQQLQQYTGTYQLPNGNTIQLKAAGGQLSWEAGRAAFPLFANSEKHFYAMHEFFNIHFKQSNGQTEGFEWVRYGTSQFAKKIN